MLVAAILPIPLILRWNRLGVALGTVVVWGSLAVAGFLLAALGAEREGITFDTIWLLFGWIGGLIYCVPIYVVKRVASWLWRWVRPPAKVAAFHDLEEL